MDIKSEIRDFLTSRRARIMPEEAGLKSFGQRRVPGLRREEVATLAGLSIEYYNTTPATTPAQPDTSGTPLVRWPARAERMVTTPVSAQNAPM